MSTTQHTTDDAQTGDLPTDADDVTLQEVLDHVHEQDERIADLEADKKHLQEENEQLREEVRETDERIDDLEDDVDWVTDQVFRLEEFAMDDWSDGTLLNELGYSSLGDAVLDLTNNVSMEQVKALREKQMTDHQSVKRDLARVRRQLNHVSEETDVDLLDAVPGDDKIAKAVKDGIATVTDRRITAVYERAELILHNLEDWGTVRRDANGAYIYLTAPAVKEKLETARSESLQTNQVKRVFRKIVGLADDSPRYAKLGKTDSGTWRLKLGVTAQRGD